MGKGFRNNKTGLRIVIVLSVLLFAVFDSQASSREFQLFDEAYKYYLSYQPEKAVEEFRIFLKEFPDSSAKDAVLFWLGKSLVQIKSVEEAKKIFSEIKQQFPESPFITYAKKEAEMINAKSDLYKTESGRIGETKAVDNVVGNQAGVFNEEKIQEIEPQKTVEDKRQTTPSTDGELRNTVGTNETADSFVDRDKPENSLRAVSLSKKKVKYSVQIGVFKKQNSANELRLQFKRAGYPVQVTKMISRGVYLYKVMIGEFASRKEAESLALKVERTHKLKTIVTMFETIEKAEAPEKTAEVQAPEKTAEVQAPEKTAEVQAPEKTAEVQAPEKTAEVQAPEKTAEVQVPEKIAEVQVPEKIAEVQTPVKEPEKQSMEKAAEEVLFPVKNLGNKKERYEGFDIKVKNRMYLLTEVTEYIMNSQSLMNKLGIKEALWRTGNIYEDFINEQILFDETTKLSKVFDVYPYKEVIEKYGLTREETDFLYRYFSICDFIVMKLKDMPEEKVVESLTIIYSDGDKYKKTVLSTEIQTYAKNGMSFEDINKLYPDIAKFSVTGIQELQEWVREKVEILRDNEVGVVWSGNGYMVLKPISKKFSCKTSGDMSPETRNKIKAQISILLNELKTETK